VLALLEQIRGELTDLAAARDRSLADLDAARADLEQASGDYADAIMAAAPTPTLFDAPALALAPAPLGLPAYVPPGDPTLTAQSDQISAAIAYAGSLTVAVAAPTTVAATDRANINAAITAAGSAGCVSLQPGTYATDQMLIIPDGVTLRGAGGSHQLGSTTIRCTAAGAGVTFNGRGGPNFGVRIDGNAIATQPWIVGAGLDRTFINVSVANSAQDGLTVNSTQNTNFVGCGADGSARDNIVLDLGCGGLLFERFESNAAGRYPLHVQQSGASPANAYPAIFGPAHIKFSHCIFEREQADNPVVQIDQGTNLYFDTCAFSRGTGFTTPLLYVADYVGGNVSTRVETRSCLWGGQSGSVACIHPGQGQLVIVTGQNRETGGVPFIDGTNTSATVYVHDMPDLSGGGTLFAAGTPGNGQASVYRPANLHDFFQLAAGNLFARNRAPGESFDRVQWFGSGTLLLGGGAGPPDATFARVAAGAFGATNGVFRQATAAPAYSASITPNAAAGGWQTITVTNATAFTINATSLPPSASYTEALTIEVYNNSGGAMGVITWNAVYVFAGQTWVNPASTKRRFARFEWNGSNWICTGIAAADY
jgi:hypothetical protein